MNSADSRRRLADRLIRLHVLSGRLCNQRLRDDVRACAAPYMATLAAWRTTPAPLGEVFLVLNALGRLLAVVEAGDLESSTPPAPSGSPRTVSMRRTPAYFGESA